MSVMFANSIPSRQVTHPPVPPFLCAAVSFPIMWLHANACLQALGATPRHEVVSTNRYAQDFIFRGRFLRLDKRCECSYNAEALSQGVLKELHRRSTFLCRCIPVQAAASPVNVVNTSATLSSAAVLKTQVEERRESGRYTLDCCTWRSFKAC